LKLGIGGFAVMIVARLFLSYLLFISYLFPIYPHLFLNRLWLECVVAMAWFETQA